MHVVLAIFANPRQTQHEISGLRLRGLTRLIKLVGLWLIYIVLYLCLDTTQTQQVNMNQNP
jgi:hypothetical protein